MTARRASSRAAAGEVTEIKQAEKKEQRFVSVIVSIAIGGVAIGTAALIITLAILSGFEKTLTENVVGFTADAEISGYANRPLPDYVSTSRFILARVPEIKQLVPFVERQAVLRSAKGVAGVDVRGIPLNDTSALVRRKIIAGQDFLTASSDSISPLLISKGLAKELKTGVGKTLAAIRFNERLVTRDDLLKNIRKFRVIGIFETGMSQYDNAVVYTTLSDAQLFNGFSPTQVSGYDIYTATIDDAPKVTEHLNKILRYPYFARSVFEVYPTIFAWIELQKKPIPVILGLIILVATFNIISTLLLIVIEKTHSIGVLKSLGASKRGITRIFLTEGVVIALLGTLFGNVLAFVVCFLQYHFHFFKLRSDIYFMSSVPISLEWQHYAIVSAIAFLLALAATLVPARIAGRMKPLNALKFG